MLYIHQQDEWPRLRWDPVIPGELLAGVRHQQGRLTGRMEMLGFKLREEAVLGTLAQDVIKSSEIEGEEVDPGQVRSSIARRLGMDVCGLVASDHNVEGVVEMMLDATQKASLDVTRWLDWFWRCLERAFAGADETLSAVLTKAAFWEHFSLAGLNARQVEVLNRLLNGFDGNLTNAKYATLAKTSSDTALRDLNDLVERGVLDKAPAGGRGTRYMLNPPAQT